MVYLAVFEVTSAASYFVDCTCSRSARTYLRTGAFAADSGCTVRSPRTSAALLLSRERFDQSCHCFSWDLYNHQCMKDNQRQTWIPRTYWDRRRRTWSHRNPLWDRSSYLKYQVEATCTVSRDREGISKRTDFSIFSLIPSK